MNVLKVYSYLVMLLIDILESDLNDCISMQYKSTTKRGYIIYIIDTSVTYLKCTCHDIKEIKGACVLFVFFEIGIIEYRV